MHHIIIEGIAFYYIFYVLLISFSKIYRRFSHNTKLLNESKLFLCELSIAPAFFFTIVQINYHLPGKFLSVSSIGIDVLILFLFSFICYYLYRNWKNISRKNIFADCFLVFLIFGGIGISGNFLVLSELQSEHWKWKFCMTFVFCLVLPFFFLFILNLKKAVNPLRKLAFAIILITILFLAEFKIFFPIIDNLAFKQNNIEYKIMAASQKALPNIILIVMDTTRAANMSLYGYERKTTPNLELFAQDSVNFTNAISSAPWTLPSHASLFTGHLSYIHNATYANSVDVPINPLHENYSTLAEILLSNGYATGAVVANQAVLGPWSKLNQGFYYYRWGRKRDYCLLLSILCSGFLSGNNIDIFRKTCGIDKNCSSKRINKIAINWVRKVKNRPFFLFINYMDTHGVYYLPLPYSRIFGSLPAPTYHFRLKNEKTGRPILTNQDRKEMRSWYDNELTYLDSQIGQFFLSLKKLNLYDEALIIVTSDHGELLGEHNDIGHAFWLYNELLHIPLIVKYPYGKDKGIIINKKVQNIDIFAEIMNVVGLKAPFGVQGQPLGKVNHTIISEVKTPSPGALRYPDTYNRSLLSIFSKKHKLFKLIYSSDGRNELFNLSNDPHEFSDISDYQKEENITKELMDYLKILDDLKKYIKIEEVKKRKLDKATVERLRALGYIN